MCEDFILTNSACTSEIFLQCKSITHNSNRWRECKMEGGRGENREGVRGRCSPLVCCLSCSL